MSSSLELVSGADAGSRLDALPRRLWGTELRAQGALAKKADGENAQHEAEVHAQEMAQEAQMQKEAMKAEEEARHLADRLAEASRHGCTG